MNITFLGTGSLIPTERRSFSGLLAEVGHEKLLFDPGPATAHKLAKLGHDVNDINHIFITHLHLDHVLDYPTIVMAKCFDRKTGKKVQAKITNVYGPHGLAEFTKNIFEITFSTMNIDLGASTSLNLKEVEKGEVAKTETWTVSCRTTNHFNGVAYKVESHGKSIVYSGDTTPVENVIRLAKGADILIHECSFPDKYLSGLHTAPSDLGELAKEAKVKSLVLIHLHPICDGKEVEMVNEIRKKYNGDIMIAEDSMMIKI